MSIKINFKHFDISASNICIFISIFSIYYLQKTLTGRIEYFSITLLVGISVTLLIYLLFRNKIIPVIPQVEYTKSKYLNLKFFSILYALLYLISIDLLFQHLYNRPFIYFLVIASICTLVMVQIQIYSNHKSATMLILFEILLISLNIRGGILYEFPNIIGVDPTYHLNIAMDIVDFGKIPLGFQYSAHPIMHILIATTNLLASVSPKNSIIFSTGFVLAVLLPMLTYTICKRIFTVQIALISALFIAISNYLIWYGYMLFATSMGLVYFIIFLYFILSVESVHQKIVSILLFLTLVLVHPLTNVVLLFSMILLRLAQTYHHRLSYVINTRKNQIISINMIILFFLFTLAYWMHSTPLSNTSFFDFIIRTVVTKLTTVELAPSILSAPLERVNVLNEVINMLGAISLLCLGIIGVLHTIRIKGNDLISMYVVSIGYIIFFAAAVSQIIGFENILPQRWFAFAYLLFAIPASVGIQLMYNINASKKFTLYIQSIMIFTISFLMITSSIANMDSPIYSKDISLRTGYFESEFAATDFFVVHSNTTFVTDMRYEPMRAFDNRGIKFLGIVSFDELSSSDLVIIREYVINNRIDIPFRNPNGAAPAMLSQDFLQSLESEGVNTIYTNKIVNMYSIN